MTTPRDSRPAAIKLAPSALLGAALVLGWSCFDLTVFLTSGYPPTSLLLLPSMLVAVIAGAVVGALLSAHRLLPLATMLAAGLATLGTALPTKLLAAQHNWFVRAVCLLLVLHWIGTQLRHRVGFSSLRSGLALGFLGSMAFALWAGVPANGSWSVSGVVALLTLATGLLASTCRRRQLTAALLIASLASVSYNMSPSSRHRAPEPSQMNLSSTPASSGKQPDLILIVIDTLRADHLSCYGHKRQTSPTLDAFAEQFATRYTNARSTSSWTLPSHASLMTGLFPAQHGATTTRGEPDARTSDDQIWPCQAIDENAPMLAEALLERGYQTGAVVGNSFNVGTSMGFGRGFTHYDDRHGTYTRGHRALVQLAGWNLALGGLSYRDARTVTDTALAWLGDLEADRPCFLFLNYMDPHDPYLPPDETRTAFSDHQPADPFKPAAAMIPLLYDREILGVDRQVSRLFDQLRTFGRFDAAMIVVTSDHGEGLGEHGNDYHSWSLYEELLHVPLLVKPPGVRNMKVSDDPITLIGVHDMILRKLGVEVAEREAATHLAEWYRGRWNDEADLPAREQRMGQSLDRDLLAWMEDSRKIIVGSNGSVEAYDLEQDPREMAALELTDAELEVARARAAAWWKAHPPPVIIERELAEDEAARLRLLGYIDGDDDEE